jgi:hypothetical protein
MKEEIFFVCRGAPNRFVSAHSGGTRPLAALSPERKPAKAFSSSSSK